MMYQNELYHYGRIGMKWGKHIYTGRSGGSDRVIPKGTKIYRVSSSKKENLDRRIFATTNEKQHDRYTRCAVHGELWCNRHRHIYAHTYVTTKDIKVASGKRFVNETIGEMNAHNISPDNKYRKSLQKLSSLNPYGRAYGVKQFLLRGTTLGELIADHRDKQVWNGRLSADKILKEDVLFSDVANRLKKNGYEGTADPVDSALKRFNESFIVFDPKDSLKKESTRTIKKPNKLYIKNMAKQKKKLKGNPKNKKVIQNGS